MVLRPVVLRPVVLRTVHRPPVGLRPAVPRLVDRPPVGLVDLTVLAALHLAALHLVGLRPVARVVLVVLVVPNMVGRGGLDRMDLAVPVVPNMAAPVGLVAPVVPSMAARAGLDLEGLVAPVVLGVPVDPVDPVVLNMAGRVGLVAPVDRHRRRMCNTVSTTVVARSGVDPATRRTASARPTTAPRPRPRNADSAGTVGRLPEVRHPTGTARRLLAVGTGLRLLVAGTVDRMGRLATSVWHRPISGRLPTAGTTPYRCSIRFSVGGASGSSATGYRCTDLTAQSPD